MERLFFSFITIMYITAMMLPPYNWQNVMFFVLAGLSLWVVTQPK